MIARHHRLVLGAVVLGLVLRLAFALFYWTDKPLTQDEREYLALAGSLADGRGFTYPEDHETGTGQRYSRAPGYPALLAALGARPSPSAPRRVQVVQAGLGAVVVWLIAALARGAAGDRAAVVAAFLAAIYPPLVWLPAYVFSEALYMPLALGCVLLLDRLGARATMEDRHRFVLLAMAAGTLAGAAALVRSAMLTFLPFAALWLVMRRRLLIAVLVAGTAAAVIAPWTIRNVAVHGRLIVVAADGGVTFWTGNHPLAVGEGDLAANPQIKRAEIAFRQAHPGLSAEQLEPFYYRDAIRHISADPVGWVGLLLKKLFYTFVPVGPSYTLHSTRYLAASIVPYALLAPFAVVGVVWFVRQGAAGPLLLMALSTVLIALAFFPQERFRVPVIDPTVIVASSAVLSNLRRSVP